ncbi:MAG: cell division topological specificity factor MinE [Marvinbryantia sp.]|jgi:cell division topological specificity factor MinE
MRLRKTSGTIARERLKQLIIADKLQTTPDMTLQMKREIRSVIAKYVNTEQVRMEIQIRLINEAKQGEEHVKTIQIKGL